MNRDNEKTALVTGASSGIGKAIALALAGAGYTVFAGVRKDRDAQSLREAAREGRVVPVLLDVTNGESVAAAVRAVESALTSGAENMPRATTHAAADRGLDALVNNAGSGLFGPAEYLPLERMRGQFEVNVFGLLRVTQSFLPLVRRARGRIVNIGSVGDSIAMPFGGALCASKSAVRLLNDALRQELAASGIRVVLVRPASIHTPAVEKLAVDIESVVQALPPEGMERYADTIRSFSRTALDRERNGSAPDVVAASVLKALTARVPATRYAAGKDSRLLTLLPKLLGDRALDAVRRRLFGIPGFATERG